MTEGRDPMGRQHCIIPIWGITEGLASLSRIRTNSFMHIGRCCDKSKLKHVLMPMISIVVVTNGSWFPVVLPIPGAVMSSSARPLHHPVQGHGKYVSVYYYIVRWSFSNQVITFHCHWLARNYIIKKDIVDWRQRPKTVYDPQNNTDLIVIQWRNQDFSD